MRNAVFTFGKFRLFHNGHMKIIQNGVDQLQDNDPFYLFMSDSKHIDIPYDVRKNMIESLELPNVYVSPAHPTIYAASRFLLECGYDQLTCVVGSDRFQSFEQHLSALGIPIEFSVVNRIDSVSSSRLMEQEPDVIQVNSPLDIDMIKEIKNATLV